MKKRVTLACGLSEVITCSWIFQSVEDHSDVRDILVVYGRDVSMPRAHVDTTLSTVKLLWDWEAIVDLTKWSELVSVQLGQKVEVIIPDSVADIFHDADEIFLHTLWKPFEKLILNLAPHARLMLYDNGLDSHQERPICTNEDECVQGTIRSHDLRRVDRFLYTLGDYLPLPSFVQMRRTVVPSSHELEPHYKTAASRLGIFRQKGDDEAVALSIGTSLYRMNKFSAEEEAEVYRSFLKEAARAGLRTIWKAHPRAGVTLVDIAVDSTSEPLAQSIPIEIMPAKWNIVVSGSISSTALLTLKKVYGVPYQLLGRHLSKQIGFPWLEALTRYADDESLKYLKVKK